MRIRAGYEITYEVPRPTPIIMMLNVHSSRYQDLETPDIIKSAPQMRIGNFLIRSASAVSGPECCTVS